MGSGKEGVHLDGSSGAGVSRLEAIEGPAVSASPVVYAAGPVPCGAGAEPSFPDGSRWT